MRKTFTLLGVVAIATTAYAQADTDIVNIPDVNFKQALINNSAINTNLDAEITYGEARAYADNLIVSSLAISSLEGIEAFSNIVGLECDDNELTSLNVARNPNITYLSCSGNQITALDVSNNVALTYLYCHGNQLTALDVSNNIALSYLSCGDNLLTSLDVSGTSLVSLYCNNNQLTSLNLDNTALSELYCNDNQLTNLDVSALSLLELYCYNNQLTQLNLANGHNDVLYEMFAYGNPNLTCIQIDSGFAPPSEWLKDAQASYSDNCNYNLSTRESGLSAGVKVLNPVKDNLIIRTEAKVERIEIYNIAGQRVKVLLKGDIAVQDLQKGVYFIKITTNKGETIQKIIKE